MARGVYSSKKSAAAACRRKNKNAKKYRYVYQKVTGGYRMYRTKR